MALRTAAWLRGNASTPAAAVAAVVGECERRGWRAHVQPLRLRRERTSAADASSGALHAVWCRVPGRGPQSGDDSVLLATSLPLPRSAWAENGGSGQGDGRAANAHDSR
jgi:hypothetical protein